MILSDFHVHSTFSGDGQNNMQEMIEAALIKKLKHLCFTEHHDLDYYVTTINFLLDFNKYKEKFFELKEIYQEKINILFGIELGIQPHLHKILSEIVHAYPFDYILCSNHVANGIDPYFPEFFAGKTQEEAYSIYFNEILSNVKTYNDFDAYGHLDYVIRYGPFEVKQYEYTTYSDVLDEILKTLIENGKGIELNASGFKYGLNDSHPSYQVIDRYKELGGEIITVGSDSHRIDQLCNYFDLASNILKKAGFNYYTIFKNRKPEFIKLD